MKQRSNRNRSRFIAFTLAELLVVIGIIALLISLLLPSLNRVRAQSQAVACSSNLRQLGLVFHSYANDSKGKLPALSAWTGPQPPFWAELAARYMGRKENNPAYFGYVGPIPNYSFMPCPSREMATGAYYHMTYGLNYPTVFAYYSSVPVGGVGPHFLNGSARVNRLPSGVFLSADVKHEYPGARTEILSPGASGSWNLDTDTDGDNVPDSASGELPGIGVGFYNGVYPIHNRAANFLFADGSVRPIRISEWARNDDGMWGVGQPGNLSKYK